MPPPIGSVVREFLRICSKPRNLTTDSVTVGWKRSPPLYGANGGVELDTVAAVHLNLALVVNPGHAELDGALRLDDALQYTGLLVLRVLLDNRLQGLEDLANGLQELRLIAVTATTWS